MTSLYASKLAGYKLDGEYVYEDYSYETGTDLVLEGIFKFCGCGSPEDAAQYILKGLKLINELKENWYRMDNPNPTWDTWWEDWTQRTEAHHGSVGGDYFFYYWADTQDLIEHGGSVPGWLTEKGEQVISLLEEAIEEGEKGI